MGEIADMILDGTLCEGCGVFIEEDNMCHVPRSCRDCMETDRTAEISPGALQLRDKHGAGSAELAKPGHQP